MSDTPTHQLDIERVPISSVRPHPRNPRRGDVAPIAESLQINGQYRPLVVARDGTILAGNHTYQALQRLGWDIVPVTRLAIDPDSDEALRIMLADNRTSDLGTYDDALLLSLIDELPDLPGSGYDADAIEHLRHLLDQFDGHNDVLAEHRHRPPKRRTFPVRASISLAGGFRDYIIAVRIMGFEFGLLSSVVEHWAEMQRDLSAWVSDVRIAFMDNPWHDYDHQRHRAAVELIRPVAATTRDIMTRQQCKEAGVDYYTVAETVAMAAELAPYVDEVILIPKFDCISDLPEYIDGAKVVLGYSVPSSYGATPVDPVRFIGRPVHLLGGSWPRQHALLHLLGESVVSLDSNYMLKMSKFAAWWAPNGQVRHIRDLGFPDVQQRGINFIAILLSLLAMSTDLNQWNGGPPADVPVTLDPLPDLVERDGAETYEDAPPEEPEP